MRARKLNRAKQSYAPPIQRTGRCGTYSNRATEPRSHGATQAGAALLVPLCAGALLLCGCAMEKAVEVSADTARSVGVALINKAQLTQATANASGQITNPHYRVLAAAVQGVYLDIGLDGVDVRGAIQGGGAGEDVPLDETTRRQIAESLLHDPDLLDLLEALQRAAPAPND